MSLPRVLYLELDPQDGQYKNHMQASQTGAYSAGELFMTSAGSEPYNEYNVRAYHGEQVYDETISLIGTRGDSYLYRIKFIDPVIRQYATSVDFLAHLLKGPQGQGPIWMLFELAPTPAVLDKLEISEHYNLVGDAEFGG